MTFPLAPQPRPAQFLKGALTLRATAAGAITVGNASEDRWLVVVAARFSSGSISAWSAPTVDGTAMTEINQEFSSTGDDGHRGAIWAIRIPSGSNVTLAATPASATIGVFTLTGVRNPLTDRVLNVGPTDVQTAAVGAATVGYFITNFNSITAVAEMTLIGGGTAQAVGYDQVMSTSPLTYTPTYTGTLVYRRKCSFLFSY